MIQGMVLLLPAPERGVGNILEVNILSALTPCIPLLVVMVGKPTERVPPFSELFTDALIECFLAWSTARAVAVLDSWALLGVAKALSLVVVERHLN